MTFCVAFFEMRLLWMYLVVVLGVVRGQSDESIVNSRSESVEITLDTGDILNVTNKYFNISDLKAEDLRRHKGKHIWMWDLYCRLQSSKGTCKEHLKRYFYESQLDSCKPFVYTGCNGNQNNFESITECEHRCKGVNFMAVNEQTLPTVCYLQPDSGLCLSFATNYYYDVNARQCKEFTFGGCGGNLNRFEDKASCEEYCISTKTSPTTTTEETPPPLPKELRINPTD